MDYSSLVQFIRSAPVLNHVAKNLILLKMSSPKYSIFDRDVYDFRVKSDNKNCNISVQPKKIVIGIQQNNSWEFGNSSITEVLKVSNSTPLENSQN